MQLARHLYHVLLVHEGQPINSPPLSPFDVRGILALKGIGFALNYLGRRRVVGVGLKILMRERVLLALNVGPFILWKCVLLKVVC